VNLALTPKGTTHLREQNGSVSRQERDESQPTQAQELTEEPSVEEGTVNALQRSHPGNTTSIISVQQEHNERGSEGLVLPDLSAVIQAWERLREDVRQAILLLVDRHAEKDTDG
jgi:hypothetical protein